MVDQASDQSDGQGCLPNPEVINADGRRFSPGSPLPSGVGLGSFSSKVVKYSGSESYLGMPKIQGKITFSGKFALPFCRREESASGTETLGDLPRAQEFADNEELRGREAVINLAGRSPLKLLPTLLAKSRLVISVNTGIMHMAAAVGAQLIDIHGPTSPLRWGPLSPTATIIKPENMACSPCLNLGFEYNGDQNYCLQSISSKVVINALENLLTW